jgi:hypothetical protein
MVLLVTAVLVAQEVMLVILEMLEQQETQVILEQMEMAAQVVLVQMVAQLVMVDKAAQCMLIQVNLYLLQIMVTQV